MADHVAPEGSVYARIYLIGEAPGYWEHVYGRPFVGPSYKDKLLPWWNDCVPVLTRDMFRIDNVLDYQPRHIDAVSEYEMRAAMQALEERIAQHIGPDGGGPVLIVPLGNYSLYALTGKGCVSFHNKDGRHKRPGITQFRGSIMQYQDRRGRLVKLIPSIHPAASFKTPAYEKPCRVDWQRIAGDAQFRELRLPQRTHMIAPRKSEFIEWCRWTRGEAAARAHKPRFERLMMSFDIETPKNITYEMRCKESKAANPKCATCGHTRKNHEDDAACTKKAPKKDGGRLCTCGAFQAPMGKPRQVKVEEEPYLGCIGYSWDENLSMTAPTTIKYWQDPAVWAEVKAEIAAMHADPNIDYCGQNAALYDCYWCATEDIPLVGTFQYDLMKMHRVRCPADWWHDLAYQSSLYTRQPYWKDEAKDPDSIAKYAHNNEALWTYNGIDNCQQRALLTLHIEALEKLGRLDYFLDMEAPVDEPLLEMSLHGIRTDEPGRALEFDRVCAEAKELAKEINADAGMPLFGKAGLAVSNAKMKHFLYEHLHLPVQYTKNNEKQKVVSVNVVSILRLMERFPVLEQLHTVGRKTLKHRRLNTIKGFVKTAPVDPDGRIRAQFVQDTLLGRLASRENPRGGGRNLQNIDRKLRKFFLPDTGMEA